MSAIQPQDARVDALRELEILDTPPEQAFERITLLAREIFQAPMAAISLLDENRQWFKSKIGFNWAETPRAWSFCTWTIQTDEVLVVPDAFADPRFRHSPLVTGEPYFVFYAGAPLRTPDGHNIGALCVMDVVPRPDLDARQRLILTHLADIVVAECYARRKEIELAAAKDEADRANRAKGEFLSRVSHELRTPMNVILGFTQLLELDPLSEDQRSNVARILKASTHLLTLLNEVLEIARIEAGRLAVELEPVKAGEVIREAAELVQPLLRERNLKLRIEPTPEKYSVVADPQKLTQILLNLLSNAIKYNKENGEIAVAQEMVRPGQLQIRVTDTGPGIPAELQSKLFQPFERLDAVRTKTPGTGLGLALCKKMVDLMRGQIGLKSAPGAGSTFWVQFALCDFPPAEAPIESPAEVRVQPGEPESKSGAGYTVLYIEDTLVSIHLIRGLLKRRRESKVRLISAMQGNLGIEMARIHHPALILLDLHLPDVSGIQVLRELKADARTASIPVVVLTADALPGTPAQVMEAGAVACLSKPVDVSQFLKTIDSILEESNKCLLCPC